ncbi:nickel pincer cofactor biosynthesis protein LarC [Actinoplanes sp. GCM10030250]|uniref:nickel pincer cofactor biosynthesis protein LarC n=1 Tax=Actinoplanes sp. GCM10030250 TaxID=3273376 RepID=UPI0036128B6A
MSEHEHVWIDASAGVAGDMLLGALIDAGADLRAVQRAVDAVVPDTVRISCAEVTRAGLHAVHVNVEPLAADVPGRTWLTIRELLAGAELSERVRERAIAVFARLADAEARVHGVPPDDVHFHEVGAWDSIADVVGVCAALEDLGVTTLSAGEVSVGSGRVRTAHGDLPVPVPAVAQLALGWRIHAGGTGELATPTGMALIRALAARCEDLPSMRVSAVGAGAGSRDTPGRANVVRVILGTGAPAVGEDQRTEPAILLEANVDDLDPRLWPGVLAGLLRCGAADAWLVPIVMKKGRPAHTLSVLCHPGLAEILRERIFRDTSTLGVRDTAMGKFALARAFVDVRVAGGTVAVKVGHHRGVIVQVMPEFDDVAELAGELDLPQRQVLAEAAVAAAAAGLTVGAPLPATAASPPGRSRS